MARTRRDDPGMAAGARARGADGARSRRAPCDSSTRRPRSGTARPPRTASPATASSSPGSPAATEGREAAVEAERIFRSIGARGPALGCGRDRRGDLGRAARPTLRIQSLGRFRLVRDGEVVPTTAWQSKKARDLLKILVARRGRPDDARHVLRAALAGRGSRSRSATACRSRSRPFAPCWIPESVPGRVLRAGRQELDRARPRPPRAGRRGVPRPRPRRRRGWPASGDASGARSRLEAAEALYGGDFLEEDPYEDWAVGLREEAQATYISHRPITRRGRGGGRRRGRSHPLLPPDPRARRVRRRRPPRARRGARRRRSPRRGPSPLRLLRGEDGGDRRRGGAVPGPRGSGPRPVTSSLQHVARRRLRSTRPNLDCRS